MAAQQHSIPDTALSEHPCHMERSLSADFAEDYEAWAQALQDNASTAGPQHTAAAAGPGSVRSITWHLSSRQTVPVQQAHGSSMVLLAGLGSLQPNSSVFLCGVSGQLCDMLLQQTQGGLVATVSAAIALQPAQAPLAAQPQSQPVPAAPLQAVPAQPAAAQPDPAQTAHVQPERVQPQSAQSTPEPAGPVHPPDHVQAEYMLDVPALVAPV